MLVIQFIFLNVPNEWFNCAWTVNVHNVGDREDIFFPELFYRTLLYFTLRAAAYKLMVLDMRTDNADC
jgi:hypothetical protein